MTHLCTAYCLLITTLIANADATFEERIMLAVGLVREYAAMSHVDALVSEFINLAQ